MPRTIPSMNGVASMVSLGELATMIYIDQHHFENLIVCSNRNSRVNRTCKGEGDERIPNPFWGQNIEKVYCAVMRNNFSFPNTVENDLRRRGKYKGPIQVEGRTWGKHLGGIKENRVPRTPFIIHDHSDGVLRIHGKFRPRKFDIIPGETGYYVDGKKINDFDILPFVKVKKAAEGVESKARQRNFPVNCRLEDILYIKVSGEWYRLKKPSTDEIEALAIAARNWAAQLAPA